MKITPENDANSGLQRLKDHPDRMQALARLSQEYIPVGERRLKEAREIRLQWCLDLRAEGVTWRRLTELTGLSDDYLQRELKKLSG